MHNVLMRATEPVRLCREAADDAGQRPQAATDRHLICGAILEAAHVLAIPGSAYKALHSPAVECDDSELMRYIPSQPEFRQLLSDCETAGLLPQNQISGLFESSSFPGMIPFGMRAVRAHLRQRD